MSLREWYYTTDPISLNFESTFPGEHHLLAAEDAEALKQPSLKALAEQAVETLVEGTGESSGWLWLYAILGDLPPYEDLVARLRALLRQTNLVELYDRSMSEGTSAMLTTSLQVMHFADEDLRQGVKNQLIELAEFFADWESSQPRDSAKELSELGSLSDLQGWLIESALNVAIAAPSSQDVFREFAELLARLVEIWNSMVCTCKPLVQALSEELPIHNAQEFWPLLVRLRAE